MSYVPPPPSIQADILSDDLNSMILFTFLSGIYTIVFALTIYLYNTKNTYRSPMVTSCISALFLINTVELAIGWHTVNQTFIHHGESRKSAFLFNAKRGFSKVTFANSLLSTLGYMLADGLLLWRCYRIVGRSLHSMSVPISLFLCEIALALAFITTQGLLIFPPGITQMKMATISSSIDASLSASVALTSVSTTYLISRRILQHIKNSTPNRRHYRNIILIVIESSATYSFFSVLNVIPKIFSAASINKDITARFWLASYIPLLLLITTGMAPTLMVAQISLFSSSATDGSTDPAHLTTLRFRWHSNASSLSHQTTPNTIFATSLSNCMHDLDKEIGI